MIKKFKQVLKIKIFSLILISALNSYSYSLENKIILKIDNNIITNIDVDNEVIYLKTLNPNLRDLKAEKIYEIAKNSLIRENIKKIEIKKNQLNAIDQEYLENIIENIYKNIGLNSKQEFINYLKTSNIDLQTIKKKLVVEAQWNLLIFNIFRSKIKIDKLKISDEIKSTKSINSYFLYEILFDAKNNIDAKEKFNQIIKSIDENGVENTASIFSLSDTSKTGGKLGWIKESALSKKISRELKNIQTKQTTKPILIPGGFLILYVKDIKKIEEEIDFDKEYSQRIRSLQNLQLNQYSNIYFNKIKKNLTIYEQ